MRNTFLLTFLSLWAFTLACSADLVLYDQKVTKTVTGAGSVTKCSLSGGMIIDLNTRDIAIISLNAKAGRFSIQHLSSFTLDTYSAGPGKDGTVLAIAGNGSGAVVAKGQNVDVDLSSVGGITHRMPRTFAVKGTLVQTTNNTVYLAEFAGSFVLGKSATLTVNSNGYSLNTTVQMARDALIAKGYTEEDGASIVSSSGVVMIMLYPPGITQVTELPFTPPAVTPEQLPQ